MSSYTLDDIRKAADARFGYTEIDGVKLRNPLRMSQPERARLAELQKELSADEGDDSDNTLSAFQQDQEGILRDCIRLVAEDKKAAERLLTEIGDDLATLIVVFETYGEGTQAGEA